MKICDRYLELISYEDWITIINKYQWNSIIKYKGKLISSFYIPPELIFEEYRTSRTLVNKDNGWANTHLNKIITTVTNGVLNSKDYIDIFKYNILDGIGPICKRSDCNNPLSFTGKISGPYYQYCSKSCGTKDLNDKLWKMENSPFKTDDYKDLKKRLAKEMAKNGRIGLANKYCSLGNTLSQYSDYDELYFYIINDNYKFKIGISRTYSSRIPTVLRLLFNTGYNNIKIYKGPTEDIVKLENNIKFSPDFISNRFDESLLVEGWMETFNISKYDEAIRIISNSNIKELDDHQF
jgi:hypothetical protein